jgi:Type II CAAX prenyl endopeptidase Rce1-like
MTPADTPGFFVPGRPYCQPPAVLLQLDRNTPGEIVAAAIRTACIVTGISALALLAQKLIGESGFQYALIMRQHWMPGALVLVEALETLSYGAIAVALAYGVARPYWRELFPIHFNLVTFAMCAGAGVLFALLLNHPAHVLLSNLLHGGPAQTGGTLSETVLGELFANMALSSKLLTMQAAATVLLAPFVEELVGRGIVFKEMSASPWWQAAVLSFVLFSCSHYAIGGMAKALAVMPSAILFIAIRGLSGSFIYAFATHAALNAAALLKLEIL